jgi:hypothetical protein
MNLRDIKIEKGIPIPAKGKGGGFTDLFKKMKVGDSVYIAEWNQKERSVMYTCASAIGLQITSRREGDGLRIWVVGKKSAQ